MEEKRSTVPENNQGNREDTKSKISEMISKLSQNQNTEDNSAISRALNAMDEGNTDEALFILKEAAEAGDAEAQINYAYLSYEIDNDLDKASFWAKKAAEGGNVQAQEFYGLVLLCSEKDSEKEEGFRYLERAANVGSISAMITYAEAASMLNAGKVILSKAISYCSEVEQKSNDSYEKDKCSRMKTVLKEKYKKVKLPIGPVGCLLLCPVILAIIIAICLFVEACVNVITNPDVIFEDEETKTSIVTENEKTPELGTEIIELHELNPEEEKQITVESENGYTTDNNLWDGAFVYRAGNGDNTAYAIYDIGGHFEKVEFEATPWLGEGYFFESSTADIMIINAETNDIIYTETINYNSGVISIEADITGVNKLGIYVKKTNGMLAYIFIKDVYLYPEGMNK